jgi:hypothetical protein
MQMGEFLEYIRWLHYKLCSVPKRPQGKGLDYDSVDDITDLEEEGILTTSGHLLSEQERKNLKQYVN